MGFKTSGLDQNQRLTKTVRCKMQQLRQKNTNRTVFLKKVHRFY